MPSKSKQSGSYFEIHFSLKQARTQDAPTHSFFDSEVFAAGEGGTGRGKAVWLLQRAELSSAPPACAAWLRGTQLLAAGKV